MLASGAVSAEPPARLSGNIHNINVHNIPPREMITGVLADESVAIVDLVSTDDGTDIEFEPERLGLTERSAQL